MPYRNKQMLRDANGDLIPQYWDVAAGDFKPLTGSDGANDTRLTGSIVEEKLLANSLEVAAGANVRIVVSEAEHDINEIAFGVFNETGEGEFRLNLDYRFSSRAPNSGPLKLINYDGSGYYMGVERHKLLFPQLRVTIVNRSEFEQIFTVYQFGWR